MGNSFNKPASVKNPFRRSRFASASLRVSSKFDPINSDAYFLRQVASTRNVRLLITLLLLLHLVISNDQCAHSLNLCIYANPPGLLYSSPND